MGADPTKVLISKLTKLRAEETLLLLLYSWLK